MSEPVGVEQLYSAYSKFVLRSLLRLGVPRSRLEDASQEVFLVATRRYESYDPALSAERTWIFGIALRIAANERVKQRRSARSVERESAFWRVLPDKGAGPEAQATSREDVRLVTSALSRLSDDSANCSSRSSSSRSR